ncbi:MAG: hypothetical protein AAGE52_05800 [Myxococcota bacterium]
MSRLRVVALLLVGCGATAPQASAPPPASTESAPNTLQLHIVSRFLTRSVIAADDSGTRFAAGPWRVEMTAEGARVSEDRTFLDIGAVNRCGEGWLIKSEGGLFAYASEFLGPMEILGTELTLAVDRHGDGAIVVGEPAADIDPFFIDCQVPTLRRLRPSAADVVDAVHDGDDILALTMDGLVYESRDRGVSWARVPLSDPAVAIDHGAESAVMLAGGGRHPWRTVDRPAYRYDPLADEIRDQVAIAAMAERPELRFTLRDARTSIATADGLLAYRAMPSAAVLFADHAGTLSIDPSPLASSNLPLGRTQVGPRCRLDRWGSKIGFWCGEVFTARREEIRPVGVLAGRHVLQPIYSTNGRHLVVDASCGPDSDLPEDLLPYCFVDAEEGVRGRSAPVTDGLLTIVGSTVVFANADVLRMVPLRGPAQEFPLFHAGDRVEVISARALTNHRVLLRGQTSGEPLMSVGRVDESPRWRPVPALYFDFADLGFGVAAGENASEIWVTYDRDRWHPIAMDVASLAALGQRRVDKVVCDLDGCQVGPLFLSRPEGTPVVAEFANPHSQLWVVSQADPCEVLCRTRIYRCSRGLVTGLAFDSCDSTLYVTDGQVTESLTVVDPLRCSLRSLGCCRKQLSPIYRGLAVVPGWRGQVFGRACATGSCPACPNVAIGSVGDPSLGGSFTVNLQNGPIGALAWLLMKNGPCGPAVSLPPPYCGELYALPASMVLPPVPLTGFASCTGQAAHAIPIPAAPSLCGMPLCFQWFYACGTSGTGLTPALEVSIVGG